MKLGFEEQQTSYDSGSQNARAWTERWVKDWLFCPNCGHKNITQFAAMCDDDCPMCGERHMSPIKSSDLTEILKPYDGAFAIFRSDDSAEHLPNYRVVEIFGTYNEGLRKMRL